MDGSLNPIPDPTAQSFVEEAFADAMRAALPPKRWRLFLDSLERSAERYERFGSVVKLRGLSSPVQVGLASRKASIWLKEYVSGWRPQREPSEPRSFAP